VHGLHPSLPTRLAVYALFAFSLGLQAFSVPDKDIAVEAVALFCLAVSLILAVAAIYLSLSSPAPLTATPPLSASTALVAFFVATWGAPFHYLIFYFALAAIAGTVAVLINVLHLTDFRLALLILLALAGCSLLEYLFLYLVRITADSLPPPLALPLDK
jgi:hypothetical protein